ncbi:hypothetical protein CYMTET_28461 [Cymbomonas tetramitiformis]|uniref:Uncharacterized protein n=1 Tax=Cymbomonas tetramitiformis TaxID=36881 RepID=A0AAE0FNF2_9CHLO|nr:hypothetical protein CYMTET_28461 [Cymbomonas tetramitiformis]
MQAVFFSVLCCSAVVGAQHDSPVIPEIMRISSFRSFYNSEEISDADYYLSCREPLRVEFPMKFYAYPYDTSPRYGGRTNASALLLIFESTNVDPQRFKQYLNIQWEADSGIHSGPNDQAVLKVEEYFFDFLNEKRFVQQLWPNEPFHPRCFAQGAGVRTPGDDDAHCYCKSRPEVDDLLNTLPPPVTSKRGCNYTDGSCDLAPVLVKLTAPRREQPGLKRVFRLSPELIFPSVPACCGCQSYSKNQVFTLFNANIVSVPINATVPQPTPLKTDKDCGKYGCTYCSFGILGGGICPPQEKL